MRVKDVLQFAFAVAVSEIAGVLGSFFTKPGIESGWYAGLMKHGLTPPDWVFGPVWTALYFLVGVSLYLALRNGWRVKHLIFHERKAWNPISERLWRGDWQKINAIAVFSVHYILNILWSAVFFGLRETGLAFFVIVALWVSVVYVMANFYRISKPAAWLLVPYLLWVSFATYLNFALWMLN